MKKRKARFFGKLVLEMRLFQVAIKNNVKHVFKFIPHQTMTKSDPRTIFSRYQKPLPQRSEEPCLCPWTS